MYRSDYRKRLEDAIEHFRFHRYDYKTGKRNKLVPIETVEDLLDAIEKRATTEKQLRKGFGWITGLLEPRSCTKSHCEHFTSYAFCNCSAGRVPARCPDYRKYIQRWRERKEKALSEIKRCTVALNYHVEECEMCSRDHELACIQNAAIRTKIEKLAEKIGLYPWKEKVLEIERELENLI